MCYAKSLQIILNVLCCLTVLDPYQYSGSSITDPIVLKYYACQLNVHQNLTLGVQLLLYIYWFFVSLTLMTYGVREKNSSTGEYMTTFLTNA